MCELLLSFIVPNGLYGVESASWLCRGVSLSSSFIRHRLPPANLSASLRSLLPNNLVPKYDPCLARFFVSPVEALDPNYCIYFEDEFQEGLPVTCRGTYSIILD
jgi:hypothetical protein